MLRGTCLDLCFLLILGKTYGRRITNQICIFIITFPGFCLNHDKVANCLFIEECHIVCDSESLKISTNHLPNLANSLIYFVFFYMFTEIV